MKERKKKMFITKKAQVRYFTTKEEDESIDEVIKVLRAIAKESDCGDATLDVLEENADITFSFDDIENAIELLGYLKEFGLGYSMDE